MMRRLVVCDTCKGSGELVSVRSIGGSPQFFAQGCRRCGTVGYYPVVVHDRIPETASPAQRRRMKKSKGSRR